MEVTRRFFGTDVRKESQVRDLVSFAEAHGGGVDVLVNNASAPHATRWTVEAMRRGGGGAIVNISSISGLWHGRMMPGGFPGYDVAKAGMIRMTTRLASLAEKDGIRVNCLAPGRIATGGSPRPADSAV